MAALNPNRKLGIDVERQGDADLVRVTGEVDLNVSPQLRVRLKELTRQERPFIVIDMSGVPYIDSSGVATLVECLQGVSRYRGKLRLAGLTTRTSSVFEISRLNTVFSICGSVEEALRA
jgi:anti-sigma B factor antagonist